MFYTITDFLYMHPYIHTYIYVNIHTHIYICVCTYVCMYIYIYIYIYLIAIEQYIYKIMKNNLSTTLFQTLSFCCFSLCCLSGTPRFASSQSFPPPQCVSLFPSEITCSSQLPAPNSQLSASSSLRAPSSQLLIPTLAPAPQFSYPET